MNNKEKAISMENNCPHENICLVTQTPTDGKVIQPDKFFVECSDCKEILPIRTVTQRSEKVPLINI